ncbi:hypothetical protein GIB67_000481 [Kingdonia uniflora]|uniref:Gamma-glutamylcyclotransferase family protein n=1 Tax=Kingdonia uniflora TaxID=39325 RepID=A0A7J7L0G3_9MAGN|nr:hypothetical protein GIB67_000481 [Kingdonia uniflora]
MGAEKPMSLIFTYGTLKQDFPNHPLIQSLILTGDANYLGVHHTLHKYPLVCGPHRVPFLLNFQGQGHHIRGELYSVSKHGLDRMDELEGTSRGHYERLPVDLVTVEGDKVVGAEAYYGHRSYAMELWRRNGEKGFCEYSEDKAKGYVRRGDRDQSVGFLEHILLFISSSSSTSN